MSLAYKQLPARPEPVVREEPPAPWRWGGLAIVLIAIGVWQFRAGQPKAPVAAPVRMATARMGAVERTLRITGSTTASHRQYLTAPKMRGSRSDGGGHTLTLQRLAAPGIAVKRGQVVAEFDRQHMLLRLDDFRSSVLQQEAGIRRLRANLDLRRVQAMQRIRAAKGVTEKAALDLRTAPARSQIQVEHFRMNLEEAQARYQQILTELPYMDISERASIRRSEIDVIQAQNELKNAERNAEQMVSRAPMDGIVVLRRNYRGTEFTEMREGDQVGPGQVFGEVVDPASLYVDGSVNQVDAEQVKSGLSARVHFDAFPDIEIPARVIGLGAVTRAAGQRASYVREIPVRLELEGSNEQVIPDLTASADIVVERESDAVIVPVECVVRVRGQKPFAMVQTESGWERRPLELGIANHLEVVVESGVKEGEKVAAEAVPPPQP
ncbi:MAG TPA: HlyD family efflux transporter periplasmic adaptor subunit [Bryobacteraceae bacterium]|nr:HlyD family efflux transporter periplasmic adaptor subunit [Bryobacteraceae bacterium]